MQQHSLNANFSPLSARNVIVVLALAIAVAFAALAGDAFAQETGGETNQAMDAVGVADRIERLERDIRTLNQQLGAMATPARSEQTKQANEAPSTAAQTDAPAGSLDRLMARLSGLEDEVRQATGAMEGVDHRLLQMEGRLERLMEDLEFRLSRLEGNPTANARPMARAAPGPASVSTLSSNSHSIVSATPGTARPTPGVLGTISKSKLDAAMSETNASGDATPPTAKSTDSMTAMAPVKPKVLPEGTPKKQYQHAFNLLRQARYGEAEAAWKEFIEINAADKLSENARYWLGETYYVQGTKDSEMYIIAAQMFLESYRAAPRGAKAVDSLFKLGKSMSSMGKKDEACAAYGKLRKEFDAIPSATTSLLNREVERLKCK